MTLSTMVRERRESLTISKTELGRLIGVTRQAIDRWERGETEGIGARNIVALEKALHFKAGELFKAYYA